MDYLFIHTLHESEDQSTGKHIRLFNERICERFFSFTALILGKRAYMLYTSPSSSPGFLWVVYNRGSRGGGMVCYRFVCFLFPVRAADKQLLFHAQGIHRYFMLSAWCVHRTHILAYIYIYFLCNGRGQFVLFVRVQPLSAFNNVFRNARTQGALLNEIWENARPKKNTLA